LRNETNSLFRAARLVVSRVTSTAARAFSFSWFSRSATDVPADSATSTVDWPRCSDETTEFSELETARWFCAMPKIDALSFALATFRPVLIRF